MLSTEKLKILLDCNKSIDESFIFNYLQLLPNVDADYKDDENGDTILHWLIGRGSLFLLNLFLSNVSGIEKIVNCPNRASVLPLYLAVDLFPKAIPSLLRAGANPHLSVCRFKPTPLGQAVQKYPSNKSLEIFMQNNTVPYISNLPRRMTPAGVQIFRSPGTDYIRRALSTSVKTILFTHRHPVLKEGYTDHCNQYMSHIYLCISAFFEGNLLPEGILIQILGYFNLSDVLNFCDQDIRENRQPKISF